MSQYTVTLADSSTIIRARKDAAIKVGEASGQEFTVASQSGAIVFKTANAERPGQQFPAETPAPTEEAANTEEAPVADETTATPEPKPEPAKASKKTGIPVAYTNDHGAKRFFPAAAAGAVALAESMGLTVTTDNAERVVYVDGTKTQAKAFQKQVTTLWTAAWAGFKEWKKENKDARKVQWASADGKREMFADEVNFLTTHMTNAVAASDVI